MAINNSLEVRFEAFKARIENRLQELFNKFKRSLSECPNKFQHGKNSNLKGNRFEKYDQGQDIGYPRIRVEFLRWEDGDPTSWVLGVESSFTSTELQKNPR
ncbi:hypothetical protein B296_00010850 [Ensete ventricosum]|uniref:Uncharacterized protein n=1 Tax=Ensete ventricosum TaxID=4639 RepID=A0A427AZ56_ENSVE|nr:hypothetical protein B296_00010850 [Ensete ventricosum]